MLFIYILDEQFAAISHSRQARTRATQNVSIEGWNSVPTDGTVQFTHGLTLDRNILCSILITFGHFYALPTSCFRYPDCHDIDPNAWI